MIAELIVVTLQIYDLFWILPRDQYESNYPNPPGAASLPPRPSPSASHHHPSACDRALLRTVFVTHDHARAMHVPRMHGGQQSSAIRVQPELGHTRAAPLAAQKAKRPLRPSQRGTSLGRPAPHSQSPPRCWGRSQPLPPRSEAQQAEAPSWQ